MKSDGAQLGSRWPRKNLATDREGEEPSTGEAPRGTCLLSYGSSQKMAVLTLEPCTYAVSVFLAVMRDNSAASVSKMILYLAEKNESFSSEMSVADDQ